MCVMWFHLHELTKQEETVLTKEQAYTLMEVAKGHRFEVLILVAVTTGMRKGEFTALKWQDIDFTNKCLYVRHTAYRLPQLWIC